MRVTESLCASRAATASRRAARASTIKLPAPRIRVLLHPVQQVIAFGGVAARAAKEVGDRLAGGNDGDVPPGRGALEDHGGARRREYDVGTGLDRAQPKVRREPRWIVRVDESQPSFGV